MKAKTDAAKRPGFLARLRKDQSGNTFAIFAAAIFPMVGLVGGAVDMARVYSVKTRLQAACDAGSLAARKVMGNGRWDVNSDGNRTNDATYQAGLRMFDVNFEGGFIGSENRLRDFVESNGTVTGTASAEVPMVLMQVLGIEEEDVSVTCTSQMKIPHSDVMFVLDVTGSMGGTIPGDPTGLTKLNGLKRATKCFYEALARQDIDDVTPAQCYKSANPIGDLSTLTQLRFGFVPFSQQVNVGALLPNGFMKDTQSFQSRRAELETVQTWTLGSIGSVSGWSGTWSPSAIPSSYNTRQSTSGWTDLNVNTNTLQGTKPFQQTGATSSSQCNGSTYNNLSGSSGQLTALSETLGSPGTPVVQSTSNNPPTHPNANQVLSYNRPRNDTVTQYRYNWENRGSGNKCYLERRNHTASLVRTETGGTANRPVIWTPRQRVTGWIYTQVPFDVSSLKAGGGDNASLAYNSSLLLPLNESTMTVNLSGQSVPSSMRIVSNASVSWTGCIEERQTLQNTDGDPFDEFSPIPDAAMDMDIDLEPDTNIENTRWGYQLPNAVWARHNGDRVPVTADIWRSTPSSSIPAGMDRNTSAGCVTPAQKLAAYRDAAGATSFKSYINALTATGNTYHDIGLIWGARLMSPSGIFSGENATTANGQEIQRHMIFMTDGETATDIDNYTPYGIEGWDRRRTPSGTIPTNTDINNAVDARTIALCSAIKNLGNNGVTVWVVYYGTTDFATTERMKNCATSRNNHFFAATNTQLLIESFNSIADSISELKLTG